MGLPPPPPTQPLPPPTLDGPVGDLDNDWLDRLADGLDNNDDWLSRGLVERILGALQYVEPTGTSEFTSTAVVERLSSHEKFMSVVAEIANAFDGHWNSDTRDRLVGDIEHTIPDLYAGYYLKHMIRSLSCVSGLDGIPRRDTYFKMSRHNTDAIQMLVNAGWRPSDIIDYMRNDSDGLGVVNDATLVDDDMVLELVICQAKSVWDAINYGKSPVYDLYKLADYDALTEIYKNKWQSTIGDGKISNGEVGITHSSLDAYTTYSTCRSHRSPERCR